MAHLAPRRLPDRLPLLAAAAVVLALVVSGCDTGGSDSAPQPSLSAKPVESTGSDDAPAPELDAFYDQQLEWERCDQNECATLEVPLDYAEPAGETMELSLLRVPASDEDQRVGSLVVNPGGPGASGVDYAARTETYFGPELRDAFDIVGFDPRGVGRSNPIDCVSDAELDRFVAADPDPDTEAEIAVSDRLLEQLGAGCVRRSGDLAAHMSTVEAARDIDVLRAALGDARLSYFGASYGSLLGATYAELFPSRVGRLVLDGALDPSLTSLDMNLVQAKGFETALRAYVGGCVDRGGCFLGDSVDAGVRRIQRFLAEVERSSLPAGGRRLAVGNAVLGIWAPLYNEEYWTILDTALRAAFEGNGAPLLALSDAYSGRGPDGYRDNSFEALYAVNCLDRDDAIPSDEVAQQVSRFRKASPTFGAIFAYSLASCSEWPIRTGDGPRELHASGAEPILVIGTSRDPATPLVWAEALAEQLASGVLVRRDGDGHTGYFAGNDCVDRVVESYLVSGEVPDGTVDC